MPRKPLWSEPIYDKSAEDERIEKSASNVRVNLSVPSYLYDLLNEYTEDNCLPSVPSACIQLIRLQLRAQTKRQKAMDIFRGETPKDIKKMSPEVIEKLQDRIDAPELPPELTKK